MDNFSIICNILCAVIWSANFGVVVNKEDEPGIIKVLYAYDRFHRSCDLRRAGYLK